MAYVSTLISTSCRGKVAAHLASRRSSHLHQVRVPGISADAQVIVAKLLLCGLAKDVSYGSVQTGQPRRRQRKREGGQLSVRDWQRTVLGRPDKSTSHCGVLWKKTAEGGERGVGEEKCREREFGEA